MAITVAFYTTGGGEITREFFNTVVIALGGSGFASLMKLALFTGVSWVVIQYMMTRNITAYLKWLALYYLMIHVMFYPKVNVQIIDRLSAGTVYEVANVPWGLGMIASLTSKIGYGLTELIEDNFHLPNYIPYNQTGLMFGSQMLIEGNKMRITNADFDQTIKSFVRQCIFYDVLLKKYSLTDLASSPDLWGFVLARTSPARAFPYEGKIVTCSDGAKRLNDTWNKALPQAINKYSRFLFPNQPTPQNLLLQYLPMGYQFLIGLSQSAAETMQQTMMAHLIEEGILDFGARVDAQAVLEEYAYLRAQTQTRFSYHNIGTMATYWLPIMKIVFELLLIGSFIIIFPLSLLPIGFTVIKNYVYSLLYIELWGPLFAIINLVFSFYAQKYSQGVAPEAVLTLGNLGALSQVNQDISNLAGYISYSVIFLAGFLVKGLSSALHSMAYYVGGVLQSSAGSAASEVATGNISLGNSSFNTASAFNMQAYHVDKNAQVMSGAATTQLPGGSLMSQFADGNTALNMNPSVSGLATSINLSQSIRTAAGQQADYSEQSAYSELAEASSHTTAALRSLDEFNQHQSNSQASSSGSSIADQSSISKSVNQVNQLVERFAEETNVTQQDAEEALSTGYWAMQLSGGLEPAKAFPMARQILSTFGLKGGANLETAHREETVSRSSVGQQALYQSALNFIQENQFSETVNKTRQAVEEIRFNTGSEAGQRFSESFSSQMDQAQSYGDRASTQFSSSLSYRDLASTSEEQASQINSNATQDFYDWLIQQPASAGGGDLTPSQIDRMMKYDPQTAQVYAKHYESERTQSFLKDYAKQKGIDKPSTEDLLQSGIADIKQSYQNYQAQVHSAHDLTSVETTVESDTQAVQRSIDERFDELRQKVKQSGITIKNEVKDKLNDN